MPETLHTAKRRNFQYISQFKPLPLDFQFSFLGLKWHRIHHTFIHTFTYCKGTEVVINRMVWVYIDLFYFSLVIEMPIQNIHTHAMLILLPLHKYPIQMLTNSVHFRTQYYFCQLFLCLSDNDNLCYILFI